MSLLGLLLCLHGALAAEAPRVLAVEPPGWWAGHSMSPVRLMIRGSGLAGARVESSGGITLGTPAVNEKGTCLFVDAAIPAQAAPGPRALTVSTPGGRAEAVFELLEPLPRKGRFQGFSSDDVIYLVMPDRFANGDPRNDGPTLDRSKGRYHHGGDLQGVIDRLPYVKDLGATTLWLTPVYANSPELYPVPVWSSEPYTDYHGYGPVDYYAVDPHLGDLAGLRRLVDRAHALGLKVVLDQVSNHTGPRHPWAADPPTPTWYHGTHERHLDNPFRSWLVADPYADPRAMRPEMDGWFGGMLPDLNQDDPEMARYLTQNMLWWVGTTGIDGLRHDVAGFVPRTFWRDSLAALKREYPDFRDVGEVNGGVPHTVSHGQGGRPGRDGVDTGLDSVFDFPLRETLRAVLLDEKPMERIPEVLSGDRLYPDPMRLVTTLGLHDDPRFMGHPKADAAALKLAFTLLLTTRGIPMIYYGDELAMRGGGDPDNRRDFPGGWRGDPRDAFSRAGRTAEEEDVFRHVQRLARLRAESEALRRGRLVTLSAGERTYAYARAAGPAWALVGVNAGAKPETLDIDAGGLTLPPGAVLEDRLGSAARARLAGGRIVVELPARSGAVFAPARGRDPR